VCTKLDIYTFIITWVHLSVYISPPTLPIFYFINWKCRDDTKIDYFLILESVSIIEQTHWICRKENDLIMICTEESYIILSGILHWQISKLNILTITSTVTINRQPTKSSGIYIKHDDHIYLTLWTFAHR
jgi:hypothetical protein